MFSLNCSSKSSMISGFPFRNIFLCGYWSSLLLLNLPSSLQFKLWSRVKCSYVSSLCGAWTNKFILSTRVLIFQIFEFFDMFHDFIFNFCTNIQTWVSIVIILILKYKSSIQKIKRVFFNDVIYVGCFFLCFILWM